MYALGLAVAIVIAFLVNRFLLKLRSIPFVLEMPPYRRPSGRTVFRRVWSSGREFVVRAGTVIFAFSIVIWALSYFPRPAEVADRVAKQAEAEKWDDAHAAGVLEAAYLEQSWMGRLGKAVQPVFAPAGFDWKITVGVLAAFPARELINATLAIVYGLGDDEKGLKEALPGEKRADGSPVYTLPVAAAIMVFIAFCLQCGSTVAVMAREAGWRWAGFAFAYMTALAWVGAVATYQIGTALSS
jgi:ferrous iron transport protein B